MFILEPSRYVSSAAGAFWTEGPHQEREHSPGHASIDLETGGRYPSAPGPMIMFCACHLPVLASSSTFNKVLRLASIGFDQMQILKVVFYKPSLDFQ